VPGGGAILPFLAGRIGACLPLWEGIRAWRWCLKGLRLLGWEAFPRDPLMEWVCGWVVWG